MTDEVQQALYWPVSMLAELEQEAQRLGQSPSWCAGQAWLLARAQLQAESSATQDGRGRYADEDKRKQTLSLPKALVAELQKEAARQDRSMSWLMQRAWTLSLEEIRRLSPVARD